MDNFRICLFIPSLTLKLTLKMKLESDHVQVICDSAQDYYFILLPASTHQYILLFTSFLTHKTTTTTHNIFSLVNLSHHDHAISHIKSHPKRGFTIETIFPYLWLPMVNMKTSPNRTSTSTTTIRSKGQAWPVFECVEF